MTATISPTVLYTGNNFHNFAEKYAAACSAQGVLRSSAYNFSTSMTSNNFTSNKVTWVYALAFIIV